MADTSAAARILPHNLEAEKCVLGAILIDNEAFNQAAESLDSRDFFRDAHRRVFDKMVLLNERREVIDLVTLSNELERSGELQEVGGAAYIAALVDGVPRATNVEHYAKIVKEKSTLRDLINVGNKILHSAYDAEEEADLLLDGAEQAIFNIADDRIRSGFVPLRELVNEGFSTIERLQEHKESITGVPSGFTDLDQLTSGFQPSDLVIIAARPSMGKTSLAMNIAENAAVGFKLPVAVFSMEMPGRQLAMRMLSSLGRINAHHVRTGKLTRDDWPRLTSAVELLDQAPIFIDDTPALTPSELRSRVRRLVRDKGKLGLIVVDYLQLMQSSEGSENRAVEVANITRALKIVAKEMSAPVIVLSQLNRGLEQRPNKRPVMSDLRESGAIEQDADLILFIYRDEIYNEETHDRGTAEIIIGKQRNGPTGTVRLTFLGEYTRFENFISEFSDRVA